AWIVAAFFLAFATPSPAATIPDKADKADVRSGGVADCTVYYTPREAGFTDGKGFDLRPETRPGLGGATFPADFLRAVKVEGHGRLAQAHDGFLYVYYNGRWGYTDYPKGTGQQPLVPLQSCAVSSHSAKLRRGSWLQTAHDALPSPLRDRWWKVTDVGGGVQSRQVDLYWGEDDPSGPGARIYQPAGTTFTGARNAKLNLLTADAS
ncbi:MAG TPA: hypothetical protein VIM58_07045, partial [Candidatus Methylacidiphilales bacterium]